MKKDQLPLVVRHLKPNKRKEIIHRLGMIPLGIIFAGLLSVVLVFDLIYYTLDTFYNVGKAYKEWFIENW